MAIQLDGLTGITSSGNVTAPYFYGNGAFLTGISANGGGNIDFLHVTSNIIPNANVTYSLGNATNQWKDLWVSNNTIYINSVPLTVGGANTLFVANVPVLTSNTVNTGNITTTGDLIAGNGAGNTTTVSNVGITFPNGTVQTTAATNYGNSNVITLLSDSSLTSNVITSGNVSGNYFLGNGALLTGVVTTNNAYGNANVSNFLASGTANANIITSGNITGNVVSNAISSTTTVMTLDPGADASPLTGNVNVLGNLSVTGNITYTNIDTATTANLLWVAASTASTPLAASGGGLAVGNANTPYATFTFNAFTNTWNTNIPLTVGGNVTGSYFLGNGRFLTGMYGNADVSNYLASGTNTANIITTGNVQGGYLLGNGALLTGVVTTEGAYGNANVAEFLASGTNTSNITTTGNVNSTYYYGNGSYLTGIPASYSDANVTTLLASGNVTSNIITTANVTASNLNASGNINATGNVTANVVLANAFKYANGSPVTFNQPVSVTSNIAFVDNLAPILVASDYSNPSYPGGLFTLYQPEGAVLLASSTWASGGTSKNAYANYAGNVVNTQSVVLNLSVLNGTFDVQSSDTITIGTSTITGANITGLGISGSGGNYTISSALFNSNVQINSSTAISVDLTTDRGPITESAGTVTTVAPTPFSVGNLVATWTNATVILGSATQQFTWIASNVAGSVVTGNVNLTGAFTQSLSTSNALSGVSTPIVSDTGPYVVTATYTGTGTNGAGTSSVTIPYTLAPATDIAPLYYKITANDSDPAFTTADAHYTIPLTIPSVAQGQPMPVGAQGMNTSNVYTNYNWLALPGGSGTWNWSDNVPASGNVNVYAAFDQGAFYQILEGTPTPVNLGQTYYTTIAGVPYTVVGWYGWTASQFLYLAKIV